MSNVLKSCGLIFTILIGGILLVVALYSNTYRPNSKRNGFNRKWLPVVITSVAAIPNTCNIREINGIENDHYYFGSNDPGKIYAADLSLADLRLISLNIPVNHRMASLFNTTLKDSMAITFAYNTPGIFITHIFSKQFSYYRPPVFFDQGHFYNNSFYLIGYKDNNFYRPKFVKINFKNDTTVEIRDFPSGIAPFEGNLYYDDRNHDLVYVSFYFNSFLVFDTSLRWKYIGHTVDTTNSYQIKQIAFTRHRQKVLTHAEPLNMVNRPGCISDGHLFVNSTLKADNEDQSSFSKNSVIDVYAVLNGSYLGSFYLPLDKGHKVKRFQVFSDKLVAIYPDDIIVYNLPI